VVFRAKFQWRISVKIEGRALTTEKQWKGNTLADETLWVCWDNLWEVQVTAARGPRARTQ